MDKQVAAISHVLLHTIRHAAGIAKSKRPKKWSTRVLTTDEVKHCLAAGALAQADVLERVEELSLEAGLARARQ